MLMDWKRRLENKELTLRLDILDAQDDHVTQHCYLLFRTQTHLQHNCALAYTTGLSILITCKASR